MSVKAIHHRRPFFQRWWFWLLANARLEASSTEGRRIEVSAELEVGALVGAGLTGTDEKV
jgi:hypothetical protein